MLPATADCPKVLLPIAGKPFALHQLDLLGSQGITEAIYCVGHLADKVRTLGTNYRGIRLRYSEEPEPLGKLDAIRHALPLLRPFFFATYGDSYLPHINLRQMASRFLGSSNSLRLMTTWEGIDYGMSLYRRSMFEHSEFLVKHKWYEIGSPEGFAELEAILKNKEKEWQADGSPS